MRTITMGDTMGGNERVMRLMGLYLGSSHVLFMMKKPCILRSLLPLENKGEQEGFASTLSGKGLGIAYNPLLVNGVAKMVGVAR